MRVLVSRPSDWRERRQTREYLLAMNRILVRVDQFVKLRTCLRCRAPGAYQYQQNESKFVDLSRLSRQKTLINGLRGGPGARINILIYWCKNIDWIQKYWINILQYIAIFAQKYSKYWQYIGPKNHSKYWWFNHQYEYLRAFRTCLVRL